MGVENRQHSNYFSVPLYSTALPKYIHSFVRSLIHSFIQPSPVPGIVLDAVQGSGLQKWITPAPLPPGSEAGGRQAFPESQEWRKGQPWLPFVVWLAFWMPLTQTGFFSSLPFRALTLPVCPSGCLGESISPLPGQWFFNYVGAFLRLSSRDVCVSEFYKSKFILRIHMAHPGMSKNSHYVLNTKNTKWCPPEVVLVGER